MHARSSRQPPSSEFWLGTSSAPLRVSQGMPAVRTVYARDFRNGVATLAIGLRSPMTVDEFAAAVTRLEYPRLRVVSTTGYVLELRIDSEASSIA